MEKGKKKSIMSDPAVAYNADIYRLKVKGVEALMGINDPQDLKNAVDYLKRKGCKTMSNKGILQDLDNACKELSSYRNGTINFKSLEDALDELPD